MTTIVRYLCVSLSPVFVAVALALALVLAPALLWHGGAGAQQTTADDTPGNELGAVEKALEREREQSEALNRKSIDIERETAILRAGLVAAAKAVQQREEMIALLETQVADLAREEREKVARLAARRQQFSQVLAALERLARLPPEAIIAQPGKPAVQTVRSALLLRSIIPEIERRAANLGRRVQDLARARQQLADRRAGLRQETVALAGESEKLAALLVQKKRLKQQTEAESREASRRAEELSLQASSLRDLIVRLAQEKQARAKKQTPETVLSSVLPPSKPAFGATATDSGTPTASPGIADSAAVVDSADSADSADIIRAGLWRGESIEELKGQLPFPVVGEVISRYGEVNENGVTQRGVQVRTRPSAQVVATFEGTVAFVGDFRGYGQLLIIEHSGGYHSLLAGMSRIDSSIGQEVLMGEPVGTMDTASDEETVLYVELRRDGQSINPLPWLSSRGSRDSRTQG